MAKNIKDILAELPEDQQERIRKRTAELLRDLETQKAIKSIENGRFLESEKVFEWLDSWGTDNVQEGPSCDD